MVNMKDVLDKAEVIYEKAIEVSDVRAALDVLQFMYRLRVSQDEGEESK